MATTPARRLAAKDASAEERREAARLLGSARTPAKIELEGRGAATGTTLPVDHPTLDGSTRSPSGAVDAALAVATQRGNVMGAGVELELNEPRGTEYADLVDAVRARLAMEIEGPRGSGRQ